MNGIETEVDLMESNIDPCLNNDNPNTNQVDNNNNEEDELHFYEFGAHFQYASLYDKLFQLAEKQNRTLPDEDLLGLLGSVNQHSRNTCKPKRIRENNNNVRKNDQANENINDASSHTIDNNRVNNNNNVNACAKREPANNIIKNIQQKEKRGYLNLLSKNVAHSQQDRNNITNSAIKKRMIYNTKLTSSNRSSNCSNSKIISSKNKIKSVSENKRKQTITQSIPSISFQKRPNYSSSQHKTTATKTLISPPKTQLSSSNNNNFTKQHSKLNTASLSNPKKTSPKAKSALTGSIIGSNNVSSKQTIVKSHLNKESKLKLQNDNANNNNTTSTNNNSSNTSSRKKLLNGPAFSRNIKNKNVLKYNINFKNNNTINQQSLTYNNNNNNNTKMNEKSNNNNMNQNELLLINSNNNNNPDREDREKESNSALKASAQKKASLKQKLLLFNSNIKQKPRSQEKPVNSIELNISNYSSSKNEKSFKIKNSFLTKNQSINIHSSISSRKNTSTNTNGNATNEFDMKKRAKQLVKKSILNNIAPIQSSVQTHLNTSASKKASSRNGINHSNARTVTKASGKDEQKKIQFLNYKNTKSVSKNKTSNYTHNRPTKSKKQPTQFDSGILKTKCNSSSSNVTNKNKITKNKQYL